MTWSAAQRLPPVAWLADYRSAWLGPDAIAGIMLTVYAIPVSLAYAALAGLAPQVGIYGYMPGGLVMRCSGRRASWQ